jgi:hypothetical protein
MTQPRRAPIGAAWCIHHTGASRCLDEGCDKFAPFCFSVIGGALSNQKENIMTIECQSASNPQCKFKIVTHKVQDNHHVGFVFGGCGSDLNHPKEPFVGKTEEEVIKLCKEWVKQMCPDCKCSA